MKPKRVAVGRYARVTSAARTDVIGKVTEHIGDYWLEVTVPNWTADGMAMRWRIRHDEVERSTAKACEEAASKR